MWVNDFLVRCRLLHEVQFPDMPIAFNPDDWPSDDEDVGGGPYFGYCNVPKLTSNLPFPDLTSVEAISCGRKCNPFTDSDKRREQAVFLGRPTGASARNLSAHDNTACARHCAVGECSLILCTALKS